MPDIAVIKAANSLGATLLPDNAQWTNRMQIKSRSSDRLYIVAQHKTNKMWGCSCMGWKRHRNCVHLSTMLPRIEAVKPVEAVSGSR